MIIWLTGNERTGDFLFLGPGLPSSFHNGTALPHTGWDDEQALFATFNDLSSNLSFQGS
jgi:hypothetical protein